MSPDHSLPPGFSWLLPAFRPTREEVRAYAQAISARENRPLTKRGSFLRQAELQLWVWRMENRLLPPKPRRSPRVRKLPERDVAAPTSFSTLPAFAP